MGDLTHDDIIHLLWSPSHIFGISEPMEGMFISRSLGALTTTTNSEDDEVMKAILAVS